MVSCGHSDMRQGGGGGRGKGHTEVGGSEGRMRGGGLGVGGRNQVEIFKIEKYVLVSNASSTLTNNCLLI